ncbi:hypothetical protein CRG98_010586 [Punica granatum]|uniref:Uncharacterized protein n=1 Tax=Punica granatum TaxID=22663 RepID=A0A2I0KKH4_PUNGR|nr:hypothetical protein CRG98_010586 [Punica granatum]
MGRGPLTGGRSGSSGTAAMRLRAAVLAPGCHVEQYMPNLFAKQFGIMQGIALPFFKTTNKSWSQRLNESHSEVIYCQLAAKKNEATPKSFYVTLSFCDRPCPNFMEWYQLLWEGGDTLKNKRQL